MIRVNNTPVCPPRMGCICTCAPCGIPPLSGKHRTPRIYTRGEYTSSKHIHVSVSYDGNRPDGDVGNGEVLLPQTAVGVIQVPYLHGPTLIPGYQFGLIGM